MTNYTYHTCFIFRSPQLPIQKNGISVSDLFNFSKQAFFKEAIYIASPVLLDELVKWHNGELKDTKEVDKLVVSLYKYYTRMQSRCTPYGLFAACASGKWGGQNELIIDDRVKRHTRLDMNYLCALAQKLNTHTVLIPLLRFYPNNSIYAFGETLRYVEYKYVNNKRIHQINSVENSEYLSALLVCAQKGAPINELSSIIIDDEISEEEAESFVRELIQSQILVSELEPAVTGDEFIFQIINSLKLINKNNNPEIDSVIQLLISTQEQIAVIDNQLGNNVETYRNIYQNLKTLETPIEENQLFQTDLYKTTTSASLDKSIQIKLSEAVEFLNKFSTISENSNLKKFKENFYTQYEDSEVPLLEVLDTETGIGYTGKDIFGVNTLLDDIYFPGKEAESSEIRWNKQQELLQGKLLQAIKNNDYIVSFNDEEIKNVGKHSTLLPDTIPIMFRLIDNENKIYLQNCGGSSAANLLGRFAHGDTEIHGIINDITAHEEKLNKEKVLAEIVHLPESRIGNILLRPVLRNYEIPYLGKSALPFEKQIQLQDLMVSVQNNKIILRSKILNKEIIPRLSSAHNYTFEALPVYQFLCDLQTQYFEKSGLGFSWGYISGGYKFLPRAEYKNVILERAKWQLIKSDFQILLDEKNPNYIKNIIDWRTQLNMPLHVVLVEGDNELLVNFEDELSIKMLVNSIKKREKIVLEEFLFDTKNLVIKDTNGNGYTNEFIAILLKNVIPTTAPTPALAGVKKIEVSFSVPLQRTFSIGSEWLYYKFYSGVKTADKLLADVIRPLTDELIAHKWIDKFFFIRYSDPETHIRLRFHFTELDKIGNVIATVNKRFQPFMDQGLITKIQTDTYRRELERYGSNSMEIGESVFFIDSVVTLNLLDLIDGEEGEKIRWQFAVRSLDALLTDFKFNSNEKLLLLEHLKDGFIREHGGSKELKLQLDNKFRNVRKQVEDILNIDSDASSEILPLIELLEWKKEQLEPLAEKIIELKNTNQLQIGLNDLLGSYIHMTLNRVFMARQRTYELVVYDLLYRYYKSLAGREKSRKNIPIINKDL